MTSRPLTLLVVPDKQYPVEHALLDHIFCRALPRKGHKVLWLLRSPDVARFGERGVWGDTELYLVPAKAGESRPRRILDALYFKPRGLSQLFRIVRERKVDVVLVRNDLEAALLSLLACRIARTRFVYYLAFPYWEAAAESARRGWTRSRWLARGFAQAAIPIRNRMIRLADFTFTMSDYWRSTLAAELALPPEKVEALPFGFDTTITPESVDGSVIRERFGLGRRPVLLYVGTIGPPRDVTILADIMKIVVQEFPESRLLILPGKSSQRFAPRLERAFVDRGVHENVIFAPPVPHNEVWSYIAAADLGLSPIEPCPVYNVSSPAKFVEMLGMGCPVVASDTPEQRTVLEEWRAGLCVPHTAEAFAKAIVHLLRDPAEAKLMGARGRRFVESSRSFARLADKVETVCYKLAGRS